MAGKHVNPGRPNMAANTTMGGRHSLNPNSRVFDSNKITVGGAVRDSMGTASLMGSSVPKGLFSSAIAASHASGLNTLVGNEVDAQRDIASAIAGIDAVGKSRQLRAVARNAEGVAPTASPLSIQSPRLMANGRGPRVVVKGMVAGDTARAVAMFDRYGYTVNRAMVPPRLDPMTSRSYWQLDDPTILGDMPQRDREVIGAAFEQGVTVWTDVAAIGTKSANSARAGVSY